MEFRFRLELEQRLRLEFELVDRQKPGGRFSKDRVCNNTTL